MSEKGVTHRLFCRHRKQKRNGGGRYGALRGNSKLVEKSGIRASDQPITHPRILLLPIGCSQPIVSHGAGNHKRVSIMASYVPRQRVGAG